MRYEVNGVFYEPMSDFARNEQLQRIAALRTTVEQQATKTLTPTEQAKELALCMQSFEHFCDYYLHTFNPRIKTPTQRFILYDYQRPAAHEIIRCIREGDNLLIEKSRDMGASWLVSAVLLWMWFFEPEFHAHLGSRVEDLVDDYTVDSLFGKFDYMLERLPNWMKRVAPFNPKEGRTRLKLESMEQSLISGESSNQSFGRGPRKRVVYFDEFAYTEYDEAIWTGIADTAPCKVVSSTPNGMNNKFAELRFSGQVKILTFHWTSHPEKTEDWYREECKRRDAKTIAQELDINYQASGGQAALPQLKLHRALIVVPSFQLDPKDFKFDMGLDYGTSNPSSIHVYARAKSMSKSEKWPKQYSIWEYYKPSTIMDIGEAIKTCPYFPLVQYIWSDPSMWFNNQATDDNKAVTNLAALFYTYAGISLSPGKRGDGFPLQQLIMMWSNPATIGFHIFDSCINQIAEFEGLHFQTQSTQASHKRNSPEKLADKDNHSWDDFKYYFNRTFDATIVIPQQEIKLGYEAMDDQFKSLKMTKIKKLTARPKQGRFGMFRS